MRLALAMAVVAVGPLMVASWNAARTAEDQAVRASEEFLARDSGALATFTGAWLEDQRVAVGGWMQLFPMSQRSEAEREGLLRAVYRAVPHVSVVALVGEDGVLVQEPVFLDRPSLSTASLGPREAGSDERAEELVSRLPLTEALARPGTAVLGRPYLPPGGERPVLPIAAVGRFGERFVLGAELDLAVLDGVVRERVSSDRGIAILDAGGDALIGENHPLIEMSALSLLSGTDANMAYDTPEGQARVALTRAEPCGWTVVVAEPADVAVQGARALRSRLLRTALWAAIAAFVAALLVARTLSEPIDRLRQRVLALSEGSLDAPVTVRTGDEIGELTQAFNVMGHRLTENAARITEQRDAIAALNDDLQRRVDERTAELLRTQDELVRSGQLAAVAEMGAGLAHELNNPLSSVLGIAQVLDKRVDDPLLSRLVEEAQRCRQVVEVMTRLQGAEQQGSPDTVVDLGSVLHEMLPPVRATAAQRGVVVTVAPMDKGLTVAADRLLVGRALVQLSHALTAGLGEGGALHISAFQDDGRCEVVLTPNRPVDEGARRDDFLASGVSLWVARKLADRIGGHISPPDARSAGWRLSLPEVQ